MRRLKVSVSYVEIFIGRVCAGYEEMSGLGQEKHGRYPIDLTTVSRVAVFSKWGEIS